MRRRTEGYRLVFFGLLATILAADQVQGTGSTPGEAASPRPTQAALDESPPSKALGHDVVTAARCRVRCLSLLKVSVFLAVCLCVYVCVCVHVFMSVC